MRDFQWTGLRYTRTWVLEREIGFARGDTISSEDLTIARGRLMNYPFLHDVDVFVDSSGLVRVDVSDAWPLFPVLSVSFTEGQISEVSSASEFLDLATVYAGIDHLNFRGTGAEVVALAQFGAAEGGSVKYGTRRLSSAVPISLTTIFESLRTSDRHASIFDSTRHLRSSRASFEIGTRRGVPTQAGLEVRYQYVKQEAQAPAEGRTFHTYWLSPYLLLDHRDVEWYPTRGSVTVARLNIAGGSEPFVRSQYEIRGYWNLSREIPLHDEQRPPVIAVRAYAATSASSTPSWAHYFSGFSSGYRGYRTVKREAAEELVGQVEIRLPIVQETHYSIPSIGSLGKRIPWGVSIVAGIEQFRLRLDGRKWEGTGWGAGVLMRAPYVQLIEITHEWNREGETEIAITTGIRF